jgi:hypothetical protein
MAAIPPLPFTWDGESMHPLFPRRADAHYVVGMEYRLAPYEERSRASHNQYFASVHEAWTNLPEDMADRYPTEDHLRKWALIKAGYRDERSTVCGSKAEAVRFAAFVRPIDDYAVVVANDCTVTVYTAKSQSMRAMGKETFQESKSRVLDVLAAMIGVGTEDLKRNTGKVA